MRHNDGAVAQDQQRHHKQRHHHAAGAQQGARAFALFALVVMPFDSEEHADAEHEHLEDNEDDGDQIDHGVGSCGLAADERALL